jgi:hypothetical protein
VLEFEGYEVALDDCTDSAQTLDWIAQVAGKSWATNGVLAGAVRALDAVLDVQGNLCGGGISRTRRPRRGGAA